MTVQQNSNVNPGSVTPVPDLQAGNPDGSLSPVALSTGVPSNTSIDDKNKGGDSRIPLAALQEEREKRQALQAQYDQMKIVLEGMGANFDNNNQVVNPPIQHPYGQQNQKSSYYDQFGAAPNQVDQQMQEMWDNDPRRAMQSEIQMAMDWRDKVDSTVESQMTMASAKHKDFNQLRPEITGYLRTIPVNQRANPGVVEAAYFLVKGQRSDDVVAKAQREIYDKIQRGEQIQGFNTPGATSATTNPVNAPTITPQERNAAAALGISEADYLKHRKR